MRDNFPAFDWILKMRAQVFYRCPTLKVIFNFQYGGCGRSISDEKNLLFLLDLWKNERLFEVSSSCNLLQRDCLHLEYNFSLSPFDF